MPYRYKILAIDGGGIRGIIPAIILNEIEQRTKKSICELFDFIAGTSTGGMIALGLTKPHPTQKDKPHYKAKDLIELYRNQGKRIFSETILGRVLSIDDLVKPKFPSTGRESVLKELLGETQISEAIKEVFITSYDTELRTPIFFISDKNAEKIGENFRKISRGITMVEAAMATSAAPTFFEPVKIETSHRTNSGYYSLIDGGVFANNPTSLAIMEAIIASKKRAAKTKNPQEELALGDIFVVSLGTGSLTRKYLYDDIKNWGAAKWALPIINIVLDGQSEAVGCQLDQLLPEADDIPKQYYRFQTLLNKANDDIDDPSAENIKRLEKLAHVIIDERSDDIDILCKQLQEPRG